MEDELRGESWYQNSEYSDNLSFNWIVVSSLAVASWRRRLGGGMWLSTGNHGSEVACNVPEMMRMVSWSSMSTRSVWADLDQTGAQYSATE